jgi:hypothetical protein
MGTTTSKSTTDQNLKNNYTIIGSCEYRNSITKKWRSYDLSLTTDGKLSFHVLFKDLKAIHASVNKRPQNQNHHDSHVENIETHGHRRGLLDSGECDGGE